MEDDRPTFGSLFAGIGGIDLGLERAGWRGRWQVEWDDWCRARLADRWPELTRYGDITDVDFGAVEPVDLLAGGFPCQPVSVAGRQAAQADARWLWPEFYRAIRALRPRLILVENVPNLLAIDRGSAFGDILGDLAASGYDTEWDCIPAAAVGAPHERDRVFLVAYPDGSELRDESGRSGRQGRQGASVIGDDGPDRDVADAAGVGGRRRATGPREAEGWRSHGPAARRGEPLADAQGDRWGSGREGRPAGGGAGQAEPAYGSLADPDSLGLQGERSGGLSGNGHASLGDDTDRRGSAMAHADGSRLEGRVFHPERGSEWFAGPSGLADTIGGGRAGRTPDEGRQAWRRTAAGGSGTEGGWRECGLAEPGLGGAADGFPAGLDHCWPAPPGPQYDWEPPRTVTGRVPDRTHRLKACGNAVVPQVAQIIGEWLLLSTRNG